MMRRPRSLHRRFIAFYTLGGAMLLSAAGIVIVCAATLFLTRPIAILQSQAAGDVAAAVSEAAKNEPTPSLVVRITRSVARPGITLIPIAPTTIRNTPAAPKPPPLAHFFGFYVHLVPVRDGAILVVPEQSMMDRIFALFLVAIVAVVLGSFAIARVAAGALTRHALDPLLRITAELERFGSGDFSPPSLPAADTEEFVDLAAAYTRAAEHVTDAFLERSRVEERFRQFVAEAGHELRTPLTVVAGYVDVLRRDGVDPEIREAAFDLLGGELRRMRVLVERMMVLARLDSEIPPRPELIDVADVLKHVTAALSVTRRAPIASTFVAHAHVYGDAADLYEAAVNVLDNALKYGGGSPVSLTSELVDRSIVIRIADRGPGIAPQHRELIFERFYRADRDSAETGSGLGLAIASKAARRLGGAIVLEDARPGSTVFTIRLPLAIPSHSQDSPTVVEGRESIVTP